MKLLDITLNKAVLAACLAASFFPMSLWAGEVGSQKNQPPAFLASIWKVPKLYENKDNPYIQSFSLVGRYHGQYWQASSEGNRDQDWENRRFYVGFNTKLFKQFTLEAQISINDKFDPVYESLYDAFIQWENSDKTHAISIGRLDYVYTGMERSTSSKKIKTMERALIVNMVMPGEVVGIYAKGKLSSLAYQTGWFSGSIEDEFTSFKGGSAALFGLNLALPLLYDKGTLHLDYLYNNGNEDNNAFKPYEHILSLWHEGQKGPLGLGIDLTAAKGVGDQRDVFGLTLLPTFDLVHDMLISSDGLELVLRYHYAFSNDDHGLIFNRRYEQKVASGKGDSYNSFYLGLNFYIYGDKLKFMGGMEYFDMAGVADEDEGAVKDANRHVDGWEFITGVRLYF